jgi:hypothetical protein
MSMRKHKLGYLAAALVGFFALPVSAAEVWVKTSDQQCTVMGDAELAKNEAVTWSGDCVDGRASGNGTLEWIVDKMITGTYEGDMADGRLQGKGVLRLEVEKGKGFDRLSAAFVKGQPEGEARFDAANGDFYEGGFKNGQRSGMGYYKLVNGEEYFGDFENGQRHGVGFIIDANGDAYVGKFEKGMAKGAGVFEGDDGSKYQGMFGENLPNGAGTFVTSSGDTYQGSFVGGKGTGKFLVTKVDGSQVIEEWKDGEKVK